MWHGDIRPYGEARVGHMLCHWPLGAYSSATSLGIQVYSGTNYL